MKILVGLGNFGDEYKGHRHNIGFMAIEDIAENIGVSVWKKKFKSLTAEGIIGDSKIFLVKPQTYMNLSGNAVREVLEFYNLKAEDVIVFHDDIDLERGTVRVKQGGGTGGHNGLKSLDEQIGINYTRVRLGIGRPVTTEGEIVRGDAVTNFVLSNFAKADKEWLEKIIALCTKNVVLLAEGKNTDFSNNVKCGVRGMEN
ncbi:MAG: aminoacyl-tRNA hydrolase [Alphaproteobacteria bacterium]|nr:aminoacyl-tRNA hydrolase [Alphaproteobacteria bacterium]MCL2505502.1 aminoacyl-tRNA hydrolase [Alphaproteobacteria bacterium]